MGYHRFEYLNLFSEFPSFIVPSTAFQLHCLLFQSLVIPEKFQHILRIMGTNIDGKRKVMFAMTAIKGVGRRYANIVLKKADIDLDKRAGECSEEEVRSFMFNFKLWYFICY